MHSFSPEFCHELTNLMKWRRDVRHFKTDPVDGAILETCLQAFALAPSVGLSQPWRLVGVKDKANRQKTLDNFKHANARALTGYGGEKAALYAQLKLSGMMDAPVQLAIFCDEETTKGAGLGAQTMPETRRYSVVAAIMSFWLTARAHGLGVGWVSILDPGQLRADLDLPPSWQLVAYLCIGWPRIEADIPELETIGWEARDPKTATLIAR